MRSFILIILVSFNFQLSAIPSKRVPNQMELGGVKLKLTEAARREIQHEVDLLTRSEKYYNIKADRIKLYFPIIEEILDKEGVPTDFKYLAVQESALISDAVSSAKAVGFWQFKDFTGREVGLRIDRRLDERLNIVASTYGAAKYFKRHNFYFDNWVYAILAHMTGRGGAMKYVDESNFGAKRMTIDKKTHWYVRRFLAHMVAFEGADQGRHSQGMVFKLDTKSGGRTLKEIANKSKTKEDELFKYNKWLKSGPVPKDKAYTVLIPTKGKRTDLKETSIGMEESIVQVEYTPGKPVSLTKDIKSPGTIFIKINGIPSILAQSGDDIEDLANKSGVEKERLARFNDVGLTDKIVEGEIYYLRAKRNKAQTYFYTVKQGESLWDVSQRFGIKLKRLKKLNRLQEDEKIEAGRVLWLRKKMSKYDPVEIIKSSSEPVAEISTNNTLEEKDKPLGANTMDQMVNADVGLNTEEVIAKDLHSHQVQAGETLYGISRKYGLQINDLMNFNDMESPDLSVGQVLQLTNKKHTVREEVKEDKVSEKVNLHVVVPGETMYGIARKYGVSVDDLLKINQKENFNLSVGEKLMVK